MVLVMPSPVLIGSTFYLRVRVPSDVPNPSKRYKITLPVDDNLRSVTMTDFVKVSLETREPRVAKERFTATYSALQGVWRSIKEGPQSPLRRSSLSL